MALPPFLTPPGPALPPSGGDAPPGKIVARFAMQPQQQTLWCWAAVSSSVAALFGATLSQCQIATAAFAHEGWACCAADAADTEKCNQPWYLDRALALAGCLDRYLRGMISFRSVQAEILSQRPLGCRIAWSGGEGAHFVAISGWSVAPDGTQYVRIADPFYKTRHLSYQDFCRSYKTDGDRWTDCYFVKSPGESPSGGNASTTSSPKNA